SHIRGTIHESTPATGPVPPSGAPTPLQRPLVSGPPPPPAAVPTSPRGRQPPSATGRRPARPATPAPGRGTGRGPGQPGAPAATARREGGPTAPVAPRTAARGRPAGCPPTPRPPGGASSSRTSARFAAPCPP